MLKTYATKAHNAMPEEAGPLHILGMWCFRIAEVNIAARAGAAALYKALPSATFEEVRAARLKVSWLCTCLFRTEKKDLTPNCDQL